MAKRLFDVILSAAGLILLAPLLLLAALGILILDPGPVFYRATRAGRQAKPFVIFKFRTMHPQQTSAASAITGANDPRVSSIGRLLRSTKIDELPQLWNVLRGQMSVVGPRPEDINIVRDHYTPDQMETLRLRPGLASPGSLYNYMVVNRFLGNSNAERAYVEELLPLKLKLELEYLRAASLVVDLRVILLTIWVILQVMAGKRDFGDAKSVYDSIQRKVMNSGGPAR